MANIILISPDATALAALTPELRKRGHVVRCAHCWDAVDGNPGEGPFLPEVVALDVTNLTEADWPMFRQFCRNWSSCTPPVLILCWSGIWRGPRFALEIERLGVRFVCGI
jgi:DNA-binding response OmpR family regulator